MRKMTTEEIQELYSKADKAGMRMGNAHQPTPMLVQRRSNPMDDSSPVRKEWIVPSGVCGFAWVNIKPANSRFAKWLVSNNLASRSTYEGGVVLWVRAFGQSMEKKRAYARAFAEVLTSQGIKCTARSRVD